MFIWSSILFLFQWYRIVDLFILLHYFISCVSYILYYIFYFYFYVAVNLCLYLFFYCLLECWLQEENVMGWLLIFDSFRIYYLWNLIMLLINMHVLTLEFAIYTFWPINIMGVQSISIILYVCTHVRMIYSIK